MSKNEDVPVPCKHQKTAELPRGVMGLKLNGQRVQVGLNGGILGTLLAIALGTWNFGASTYDDIQSTKDSLEALTTATQGIESQLGTALKTTAINAGAIENLKHENSELRTSNDELVARSSEQEAQINVLEECHEHPKRCRLD